MLYNNDLKSPACIFPPDDIDPKKKAEKPYCLAFAKAFYAYYLNNGLYYTYTDRGRMIRLRLVGKGQQPPEKYMQLYYGVDEETGNTIRKGWMNVNWEILKIAVKYRNAFIGMFEKVDFDMTAVSQDAFSRKELDEKKYTVWSKSKLGQYMPGLDGSQEEIPPPSSFAEMEIYEQMGVFKTKVEYAYEKALNMTFDVISDWPFAVKKKILEDIWDFGKALVKDEVDHQTQTVKVKYCDPTWSIMRRDQDGNIIDGGYVELKTIADVRAESGLSEEELIKGANVFIGSYGNPRELLRWEDPNHYWDSTLGGYKYDGWKVGVFNCEYRTVDKRYITKRDKKGEVRYYEEEYGRKYENSKSREIVNDSFINYYRCKWIVGTDFCYDYGPQFDIPRPDLSEAKCSFHEVNLDCPSPVETIETALDQAQLAWLNFQNALAKARPDGWAFDESALINTVVGSKTKPLDMVKMALQSGTYIYRSTNKKGHPALAPNAGNPITPMPGGLGTALSDFTGSLTTIIQLIQELSGMTPQASASPLPADTGKAVSEIQLAATNNVLKPLINLYAKLKKDASYTTLLRIMLVFRHNEKVAKVYYDILGEETVRILQVASEKTPMQIGVNIVPRTSDEMKIMLEQAASAALQSGRNGQPGITLPEYMFLTRMIQNGVNPRYIEAMISKLIMDRDAKIQKENLERIDKQNSGLAQIEQQKTQATMMIDNNKSVGNIKEIVTQGIVDAFIEQQKTMAGVQADVATAAMAPLVESLFATLMPAMNQVNQMGMQQEAAVA